MRLISIVLASFLLAGCAASVVYNPMQVATGQELLLNTSGFKAIQEGMTVDQVHKIMGQELVIGYEYQSPNYKPLTIPNPYKSEEIKGTDYFVEYYIESIRQPDGIVSDNELLPIIYKGGKLFGRGWSLFNSLHLAHPA